MIKELIQEGFILKSKGYYKYAIEAFYKALEIDNSGLELMLEISECYYLLGDEERSLNYIEQVLEKNPTHIHALKLLKTIFENKNAFSEAEQTAKNIYYISESSEDLVELLKLLNKQKKYKEVFDYNVEIVTPKILYEQAFSKLFLNELQESEVLINRALEQESENSTFLLLKSKILFKIGKHRECSELLEQIDTDYSNADLLNFKGLDAQYSGKYKEALEYFLEATKISSLQDEYYYNCASTYFKMGEIQLAKKYYNLAISINPDNPNYHFALANLYYSEKHYKRALEELNYDFFEAKLLKSIILYDSGYLVLAKKELDILDKKYPQNDIVKDYKTRIENELKV